MRIQDIHVGDKVRIIGRNGPIPWNYAGKMDKWIGKVVTVAYVWNGCEQYFQIKEDFDWWWNPEDCEPVQMANITPVQNDDLMAILGGDYGHS